MCNFLYSYSTVTSPPSGLVCIRRHQTAYTCIWMWTNLFFKYHQRVRGFFSSHRREKRLFLKYNSLYTHLNIRAEHSLFKCIPKMMHVYVLKTVLAATVTQKGHKKMWINLPIFFSRAALNSKHLSLWEGTLKTSPTLSGRAGYDIYSAHVMNSFCFDSPVMFSLRAAIRSKCQTSAHRPRNLIVMAFWDREE